MHDNTEAMDLYKVALSKESPAYGPEPRLQEGPTCMKRIKGLSPGLSLVELVVTLVIGAIFFFMVGAIIIYSQDSWFRSKQVSDALDDYQFASRRLNYMVRQGTTEKFPEDGSVGTNLPSWTFSVYDPGTKATQYNQITKQGSNLVRVYGPTDPPAANTEILMRNVSSVRVDYDGAHSWAVVTVTQTTPTSNLNHGSVTRSRTITVHRNKTYKTVD